MLTRPTRACRCHHHTRAPTFLFYASPHPPREPLTNPEYLLNGCSNTPEVFPWFILTCIVIYFRFRRNLSVSKGAGDGGVGLDKLA